MMVYEILNDVRICVVTILRAHPRHPKNCQVQYQWERCCFRRENDMNTKTLLRRVAHSIMYSKIWFVDAWMQNQIELVKRNV